MLTKTGNKIISQTKKESDLWPCGALSQQQHLLCTHSCKKLPNENVTKKCNTTINKCSEDRQCVDNNTYNSTNVSVCEEATL